MRKEAVEQEQSGDPRHLEVAIKCGLKICDLLGIDTGPAGKTADTVTCVAGIDLSVVNGTRKLTPEEQAWRHYFQNIHLPPGERPPLPQTGMPPSPAVIDHQPLQEDNAHADGTRSAPSAQLPEPTAGGAESVEAIQAEEAARDSDVERH